MLFFAVNILSHDRSSSLQMFLEGLKEDSSCRARLSPMLTRPRVLWFVVSSCSDSPFFLFAQITLLKPSYWCSAMLSTIILLVSAIIGFLPCVLQLGYGFLSCQGRLADMAGDDGHSYKLMVFIIVARTHVFCWVHC